ncbi:MAG: response regulator [Gammaproteobacteria bacterium]|nr:response regulator [Gammaproteobacteria bacterium]
MDGNNKSPSVLVVEDAIFVRNFVIIALRTMGITHVTEADNGKSALEELQKQPMDLILSDWHMPEMEGIELLKAVRADEKLRHIPFLMLTSDVSEENVRDALNSGVSDFLAKPFRHAPLIKKIKRLLEHGHQNISQSA